MGIFLNQANNVATILSGNGGSISNSATSIKVASSTNFPATPFAAIIEAEIVYVTNVSGTTWTVTRGQESTTAVTHNDGAIVRQILTLAAWNAVVQLQSGTPTAQTGEVLISNTTSFPAIEGRNSNNGGPAVKGINTSTVGGLPVGVYGDASANANGTGVQGIGSAGTGVSGSATSTGGTGVFGAGEAAGVWGSASGASGYGGKFVNSSGVALFAQTQTTTKEAIIANTTQSGTTAAAVSVVDDTSTQKARINFDGSASLTNSKNYFDNPRFKWAQRLGNGASTKSFTANVRDYHVDRWNTFFGGGTGATITISRLDFGTSVGGSGSSSDTKYCMRVDRSVAGTGYTSCIIEQWIENVWTLAGKTVTVSMLIRCNNAAVTLTPIMTQYFGTGGTPNSNVSASGSPSTWSIPNSATFARYSATFNIQSVNGLSVGTLTPSALVFQLNLPTSNTTYQIDITDAQLEISPIATPFKDYSDIDDFMRCRRFYQHTFEQGTVPAQNAGVRGMHIGGSNTSGTTPGSFTSAWQLQPEMRMFGTTVPTVVTYHPTAASAFPLNNNLGTACTAVSLQGFSGPRAIGFNFTPPTGTALGHQMVVHASASAELI
jgi:hypothetical protein